MLAHQVHFVKKFLPDYPFLQERVLKTQHGRSSAPIFFLSCDSHRCRNRFGSAQQSTSRVLRLLSTNMLRYVTMWSGGSRNGRSKHRNQSQSQQGRLSERYYQRRARSACSRSKTNFHVARGPTGSHRGVHSHYEVIRATMFLRARSLALGYSAVRPDIVRRLVDALNAGIIPVVPSFGSVSASGDLAPLSHIALGLFLGEGEAFVITPGSQPPLSQLKPMPALQALSEAGLKPLALEMKEGLALNNGVQYSTALCALSAEKLLIIL